MRLLLDEMIPPVIAEQLRGRGVDAVALIEHALRGMADGDVFEHAQQQDRVLVTYDRDLLEIDLRWRMDGRAHAGVVMLNAHRVPPNRSATVGSIVRSLRALAGAPRPEGSFIHWLD